MTEIPMLVDWPVSNSKCGHRNECGDYAHNRCEGMQQHYSHSNCSIILLFTELANKIDRVLMEELQHDTNVS